MSESAHVEELAGQLRNAPGWQLDAVVSGLLLWAADQHPKDGLDRLRVWRDRIEVGRSQIIAAQQAAGVEGAALDGLMGRASTTRADRNRAKKRAQTLSRNQDLADAVDAGRLTGDQLDAIADADHRTDGEAANDGELIADISSAPADAARRAADDFVKAQQSVDDLEKRRRQQRKQREVRKGATADGLASLTISGDDESVHQMWSAIVDTANGLYLSDGGRDLSAGQHPRTNAQRMFDAAHQHLAQPPGVSSGGGGTGTRSGTHGGPRPIVIVTATKLAGQTSEPAELVGSGPIPDTLLEEIACGSEFAGTVFGSCGEVLWHGRKRRSSTKAQQLALIARDRGCVRCGADPHYCQAHHLMPWSAPGQGKTDIDGLALMCGTCHRALHERNHTLYRDRGDGRWRTRPATPNETPKPRPQRPPSKPTRSDSTRTRSTTGARSAAARSAAARSTKTQAGRAGPDERSRRRRAA